MPTAKEAAAFLGQLIIDTIDTGDVNDIYTTAVEAFSRAADAWRAPIALGDDGTLDTVLYCDACGEEMRYSYDIDDDEQTEQDAILQHSRWVRCIMREASEEHICGSDW